MPANVEVKLPLDGLAATRRRLRRLGARGPFALVQADHYFAVARGRLKLRLERDGDGARAELIAYHRPDRVVRTSRFEIAPLPPDAAPRLIAVLETLLPVWAVVRKRRELWWAGPDRVHLDRVHGLGTFLEIEARVASRAGAEAAARRRLDDLLAELELDPGEAIPGSYSDLLRGRRSRTAGSR